MNDAFDQAIKCQNDIQFSQTLYQACASALPTLMPERSATSKCGTMMAAVQDRRRAAIPRSFCDLAAFKTGMRVQRKQYCDASTRCFDSLGSLEPFSMIRSAATRT